MKFQISPSYQRYISKKAFTLIELLVVIAIIALLAAILFPVFGRARENARRAACQSQLKQVGLGVIQYMQDYDSRYPYMGGPDPNTLVALIDPYVKSSQIWYCPSQPKPTLATNVTTYGLNAYGIDGGNNLRNGTPFNRSSVTNHTDMNVSLDTIMLFCAKGPTKNAWCANAMPGCTTGTSSTGKNLDPTTGWEIGLVGSTDAQFLNEDNTRGNFQHNGATNLLYVDGHVKSMSPKMVKIGMWTSDAGD